LADSYIIAAARESGAAAKLAASRKKEKYAALDGRYIFKPIAIEILGVVNISAYQLLSNIGRKISECAGEAREASFCSKDARCSCNVSMPYCFTIIYQPMTALTERSYPRVPRIRNVNKTGPRWAGQDVLLSSAFFDSLDHPHRFSEAYSANSIAKLNYRHHLNFSDWSKLAKKLGVGKILSTIS